MAKAKVRGCSQAARTVQVPEQRSVAVDGAAAVEGGHRRLGLAAAGG